MDKSLCQTVKRHGVTALPDLISILVPYLIMVPSIDILRLSAFLRTYAPANISLAIGSVLILFCILISITSAISPNTLRPAVLIVFDLYGALCISSVVLHGAAVRPLPSLLLYYRIAGIAASLCIITSLTKYSAGNTRAK